MRPQAHRPGVGVRFYVGLLWAAGLELAVLLLVFGLVLAWGVIGTAMLEAARR